MSVVHPADAREDNDDFLQNGGPETQDSKSVTVRLPWDAWDYLQRLTLEKGASHRGIIEAAINRCAGVEAQLARGELSPAHRALYDRHVERARLIDADPGRKRDRRTLGFKVRRDLWAYVKDVSDRYGVTATAFIAAFFTGWGTGEEEKAVQEARAAVWIGILEEARQLDYSRRKRGEATRVDPT